MIKAARLSFILAATVGALFAPSVVQAQALTIQYYHERPEGHSEADQAAAEAEESTFEWNRETGTHDMAIAMSAEEAEKYDAFVVSYNPENLTVNPATVKEEERLDADMRMDNDRLYLSVSDAALKAAGGDLESSAQTDGARVVVLVFSAH